jgi:hypothetical protein
MEKSTVH